MAPEASRATYGANLPTSVNIRRTLHRDRLKLVLVSWGRLVLPKRLLI